MMKLNNKGMTLVEVIVTFVILMVLVLGLLNLVIDVKDTMGKNSFKKELKDTVNLLHVDIQNDMIKYGVNEIKTIPGGYTITFLNSEPKDIKFDKDNKTFKYDEKTYSFPNSSYINISDFSVLVDGYFVTVNINITENLYENDSTDYGFKIVHTNLN